MRKKGQERQGNIIALQKKGEMPCAPRKRNGRNIRKRYVGFWQLEYRSLGMEVSVKNTSKAAKDTA